MFPSPSFYAYYGQKRCLLTCDSGCNSSAVRLSTAQKLGFPIKNTTHSAQQADGNSQLKTVGETHVTLSVGKCKLQFEAVVVTNLGSEILAGMGFLRVNNIKLDIPNDRIIIGQSSIPYAPKSTTGNMHNTMRAVQVIRAPERQVVMPGECAVFSVPDNITSGTEVAMQPHRIVSDCMWPTPDIVKVNAGTISIPNNTDSPIVVQPNQHLIDLYPLLPDSYESDFDPNIISTTLAAINIKVENDITNSKQGHFSSGISVDPDQQLSPTDIQKFQHVNRQYDAVFNPRIGTYNDNSGVVRASINMGRVDPPPSKARMPNYNMDDLCLMQTKMDHMEDLGVLAKPEEVGVIVEIISPGFLIKKPGGGYRYVTSFNGLASFIKPPPSRTSSCADVLRFLAGKLYLIKCDMTDQFYQLLVRKDSMKYLGVMTPFKGTRVYTRPPMGLPGSSEFLDELMRRVLGDLMHQGHVCKVADDLYIGANTIDDLLNIWEEVLQKFAHNNLRLSASKTAICPLNCTILGWEWSRGVISASPHKVNPLCTADFPLTVKGLRSWMGAYKFLKSCIRHYSALLAPLEAAVGGKNSRDNISWTEELKSAFRSAQQALASIKSLTVPRRSDQLVITTDASIKNNGLGAVLFVLRDGEMKIGGFFSAKLTPSQCRWLPCELEALAISCAVNHWNIEIRNSHHPVQILTDSKPCVQAHVKLCAGEFSASARVSTFLSTLSQFRISMQHISGSTNLPADFSSRHPAPVCEFSHCQICKFIQDSCTATVRAVSVDDILNRRVTMPFLSTTAWQKVQQDCKDTRLAFTYLKHGTRPPKKKSRIKDIRTYIRLGSISRDGLLIVKRDIAFSTPRQLVVIPRKILPGLLTALHLRLGHPSYSQLRKVFDQHFYAICSDEALKSTTKSCAHCASLAFVPAETPEYSTSEHPTSPGITFAADVMKRSGQLILVTRDYFSSYTSACILSNERHDSLRSGLIQTTANLKIGGDATVRVDCATGLQALAGDKILQSYGLTVDLGRTKNINKNPVAEKAIEELEIELKKLYPTGNLLLPADLSIAIKTLNSRVRNRGLSAYEIIYQRDFNSGKQLNLDDDALGKFQYHSRLQNHAASAKSKTPNKSKSKIPKFNINPGDLIYVKSDGTKHVSRDRYLVTSCNPNFVNARKLVGSQFRTKEYELKRSEVFPVPNSGSGKGTESTIDHDYSDSGDLTESENEEDNVSVSSRESKIKTRVNNDLNDGNQNQSFIPRRGRSGRIIYNSRRYPSSSWDNS